MTSATVAPAIAPGQRLWRWQIATVAALLLGYTGYYLCRSDLSVATPLLVAQSDVLGLDRSKIGAIQSIGVLFYAIGKLLGGVLGDFVGGRRMFLIGLFGAVAATIVFGAASTVLLFTIAWASNRLLQSGGWSGIVKIVSCWFPARRYGTVMAIISLSFLFGDATGRYLLGRLIAHGLDWRGLFFTAAMLLALIGVIDVAILRSSPRDRGFEEPEISVRNVYGGRGDARAPDSLSDLLLPYFRSPSFWCVCAISFGLTLVREALNTWIPSYLVDVHHLTVSDAAQYSAMFPFVGGVATLAAGWTSDRAGGDRAIALVPCLALCMISLAALAAASRDASPGLAMVAIASVAFWLLGPYSLLAGAIALDVGGRRGSATAAGLIDTAGYAGAVLSGYGVSRLVDHYGWDNAFLGFAAVVGGAMIAAFVYWRRERSGAPARAAA